MARALETKQNVNPPDSDYPYGRIRDDDGSSNGTPVNEEVYGDFHQFFAKLLADANITPNGMPENEYSGFQYNQALFQWGHKNNTVNLDDVMLFGVYSIATNAINAPSGLTGNAQMIVSGVLPFEVSQRVIDLDNGAEWTRKYSAGVWGAWTLIKLAEKIFEIGVWDMDTTALVVVNLPLGVTPSMIRGVHVEIRSNAAGGDNSTYPLNLSAATAGGYHQVGNIVGTSNTITLTRVVGGFFDNATFSGGINRGWITVRYNP